MSLSNYLQIGAVVVNVLIFVVIKFNDLRHLTATVKELKAMSMDTNTRLSRLEGFVSGISGRKRYSKAKR
jgi:hypothetical protein